LPKEGSGKAEESTWEVHRRKTLTKYAEETSVDGRRGGGGIGYGCHTKKVTRKAQIDIRSTEEEGVPDGKLTNYAD